jgi:SsrA-binding protein
MAAELECGIALTDSEVKNARAHKVSIEEAYARLEGSAVLFLDCDIAQCPQSSLMNHEPRRPRKNCC